MKKPSFITTAVTVIGIAVSLFFPGSASATTSWTSQQGSSGLLWTSIASSSDGKNLAGVVYGGSIYTSQDFGVTWEKRTTSNRQWSSITSSSDGTRLAAAVTSGDIWTSTDSGATWVLRDEVNRLWSSITSSSDGTRLAATVTTSILFSTGRIWISADSGETWKAKSAAGDRLWSDIASSSDGTRLVATTNPGKIYTSNDSGETWSSAGSPGSRQWSSVASSADGLKLAAVADNGGIFTSSDAGATWQESFSGKKSWKSIASNSDGTHLAAVVGNNGSIWTSANSGQTWNEETGAGLRAWTTVAISDPTSPNTNSDAVTRIAAAGSGVSVWTGYVETTYNVSFDSGGRGIGPVDQTSGSTLSVSSLPVLTEPGFSFLGWSLTPSGSVLTSDYTLQENTTLYAQWNPDVLTVNFETNGGTAVPNTVTFTGDLLSDPGVVTKTGWTFIGWGDADDNAITFPYRHGKTESFTLYAGFSPNPLTVFFNSTGGTPVASDVTDGSRTIYNFPTPTRRGFNFNGWYAAPSGGNSLDFPHTTSNNSNFTLYAQWTAKPTLTVSYETSGGTSLLDSSTTEDGILSAPVNPVKSGYTFNYWATSQSIMAWPVQFPYTHGQTSNFTLYAVWSQNLLNVSLDTTGGTPLANVTTYTDQAMSEPATPSRSGYTFKGWFTSRSGGSPLIFNYSHGQTSNFKLYAQWEANLTVDYDSTGGTAIADGSTTASQVLSDPGVPTRSGYTFNGWFVTASGGNPISFPYAHSRTNSFRLYAQWTAIPIFSVVPSSVVNTPVKSVSAIQYVTVTNTGRANLAIGDLLYEGTNSSEFTIASDTCKDKSILPNATCRIGFRFSPQAAGPRTVTFKFDNDSLGVTQSVPVNGFGTTSPITVNSVSSNILSTRGGQRIIISGVNISKMAAVTIGGVNAQVAAYSVTGNNAQMTIVVPRRPAGPATLLIRNPDTGSASYAGLVYQ